MFGKMGALFSETAERAAKVMRSLKNAPPSGALVFHGRPVSEPDVVPEIRVTVSRGQMLDLEIHRFGLRIGDVARGPVGAITPEQERMLRMFSEDGPRALFNGLCGLMEEMIRHGVTRDELVGAVDFALSSHVMRT